MPVSYPLRSLLVYEEPNGSFGTDHSSTPGDYLPVPFQAGTFTPGTERAFIETNISQQYKHGASDLVHGPRSATLAFTVPIHGSGLAGNASVANATAASNALMTLLKATFGAIRGGNLGSTVAASPTSASVFSVGAGHGARFTAGGAMGRVNAAGAMEIRPIESVTTDAIVLKYGFSATPTAADVLYNATTIYLDDGASITTSLQFIARGSGTTDRWLFRGMQLASLTINTPLNDIPTLAFTLQGADWSNLTSGSLAVVTHSNTNYMAFDGGGLFVQPVGTATPASIAAPEVSITTSLTYVPVRGMGGGVNGVFGYVQQHAPPVASASFKPFYDDQTWFDAWTNSTKQAVGLQLGASGKGCLIELATTQVGPVSAPEDLDGLAAQTVNARAQLDTDATDQTTAIRRSPIRLQFVS